MLHGAVNLTSLDVGFASDGTYIVDGLKGFDDCQSYDAQGALFCVPSFDVPSPCYAGENCVFRIQFYDRTGYAIRVGGVRDLTIRPWISNETTAAALSLTDQSDGWYKGVIPSRLKDGWVDRSGAQRFKLFYGETEIYAPNDKNLVHTCSDSEGYPNCALTIDFGPIRCPSDAHKVADAAGASCVCEHGFQAKSGSTSCNRFCSNGTLVRFRPSASRRLQPAMHSDTTPGRNRRTTARTASAAGTRTTPPRTARSRA